LVRLQVDAPRLGAVRLPGLARGQRGFDPGAMPIEGPPDEDGLILPRRSVVELQPGELVPPAGEAAQAVPVPADEAHDPLGPQDVPRQPPEEALERVLCERAWGPVHEATDPLGLEVIRRPPRLLAEGGHPGGEQQVAVERATDRPEALGAAI